jgi:histidinol-phosphatase (PHP family)
MKLIDYHIHCNYSCDNDNQIAHVIKKISEGNFYEACIITHFEPSTFDKKGININSIKPEQFDEYFREVEHYNKEFGTNVKVGIEVEYDEDFEDEIAKYLGEHDFDFVLGSRHWVKDVLIAGGINKARSLFEKYKPEQVAEFYFEMLKKLINSKLFDSIAHPDIIKRNAILVYGSFPVELYKDYFHEIAGLLIKNKVCFEINTNPYQFPGQNILYPSSDLIKLLYSEGARNVTLGSDAHSLERIGERIPEVISLLQQIGFKNICTFSKRKMDHVAISELMR